jgi:hypothetical protein
MELKPLIELLSNLPSDAVVKNGFGKPMSYRGYYDQLAFEPKEYARIGDMLEHAKSALGATFTGYKGGDYVMSELTECWIAEYGHTVDDPILQLDTLAWVEESNNVLDGSPSA